MKNLELKFGELSKIYSIAEIKLFEKNKRIEPRAIIGQERAVKALQFGLGNKSSGFNIYVAGYPGTGKQTAVIHFLETLAGKEPIPNDWCYVNDFAQSYEPDYVSLSNGLGKGLKKDVKQMLLDTRSILNRSMNSKEYSEQKDKLMRDFLDKEMEIMSPIQKKANKEKFIVQRTPVEINVVPELEGRVMKDEEFLELKKSEQKRILRLRDEFKEDLHGIIHQLDEWDRVYREQIENLQQSVAVLAFEAVCKRLHKKYNDEPEVLQFLKAVKEDILENLGEFLKFQSNLSPMQESMLLKKDGLMPMRYEVNVLVDNSKLEGAPIVLEQNPTYNNLFGKIEKENQNGTLVTDFTLIRGGALHRANGGYLLLPMEGILKNPFCWEGLKRALKTGEIVTEEIGDQLGFLTTKGLKPKPIPLNIQVILFGKPIYYHLLYQHDDDFRDLFKVKADFDTVMEASNENISDFLDIINRLETKEKLLPLAPDGKSALLTYSHRLAGDRQKISTRFGDLFDLLREASHYASKSGNKKINDHHIHKAIKEKEFRCNLWHEKVKEMIARKKLLIDLDGSRVGQVNGISVSGFGEVAFGRPNRITASVSLGNSGIIDIEREVNLGGNLHSKGVMILRGYLSEKFGKNKLLNFSAQIVFEQNYSEIDGDSASSAELYALLSGLSGLPLRQDIAVTGSVNQKGAIQPVGGINEKIEGFFEICQQTGPTGTQGVMIPAANLDDLILKKEVVEAVERKEFHIYTISTIEEGIELLTGIPAGAMITTPQGKIKGFEKGSVFDLVDKGINNFSKNIRLSANGVQSHRKKRNGSVK